MKSFTLAILLGFTLGQDGSEGTSCTGDTDTSCRQDLGLYCASYLDSKLGTVHSCENCLGGQNGGGSRTLTDSAGNTVTY